MDKDNGKPKGMDLEYLLTREFKKANKAMKENNEYFETKIQALVEIVRRLEQRLIELEEKKPKILRPGDM